MTIEQINKLIDRINEVLSKPDAPKVYISVETTLNAKGELGKVCCIRLVEE